MDPRRERKRVDSRRSSRDRASLAGGMEEEPAADDGDDDVRAVADVEGERDMELVGKKPVSSLAASSTALSAADPSDGLLCGTMLSLIRSR